MNALSNQPATQNADKIGGGEQDDVINGEGGRDELHGGYGDDVLRGGGGNDTLDGGRGSDLLFGGQGNDLILMRSDSGEQRIGQLALGEPTRGDPDGEVNQERQKLAGWESMPLVSDDIAFGGAGRDTFRVEPLLNAKADIIAKHVRDNGTINWAGVAGENDELHDHWVDATGIDVIGDYNAAEDKIEVIGHTANVSVAYRDTDGDGDEESIVTIYSQQMGGGGAHTQDLIGKLIVHGDRVEEGDIKTNPGVTPGIVDTASEADLAEALTPQGDTKVTEIDGEMVFGYDTRGPNGEQGAITGAPENFIDNPYMDEVSDRIVDNGEDEFVAYLIDADTEERLGQIVEGETIYIGDADTSRLSILVVPPNDDTESIKMELDGEGRVENVIPYALFGNPTHKINAGEIETGFHELSFTAYDADRANGERLTTQMLRFGVEEGEAPDGDAPEFNVTDGDDSITGSDGSDVIESGYGDDVLEGGAGDDLLDGGRGSDVLMGGAGDDTLLMRSDAGEQRIGQLAIGEPTRGDPDGEVNQERQKLIGWESMPLVSDDIAFGGEGADTFLIEPLLNAKEDIIAKHVNADGTIDWQGVAGENDELHDHWVDATGIDVIGDYDASEDTIKVIGHTANVRVDYRDTDDDGDEESIVTIYSQQMGGGGAHTQDLIGKVIVHGDRVGKGDIETDAGVFYGIVDSNSEADLAEALTPQGDSKVTEIDGETVFGYDTRGPGGEQGPITGAPEDFIDNPNYDQVADGFTGEVAVEEPEEPEEPVVEVPDEPDTPVVVAPDEPEEPEEPEEPDVDDGVTFADVSDGVRLLEIDTSQSGLHVISGFDVDSSGSENTYDILSVEVNGEMVQAANADEIVSLVDLVEHDGDRATDAVMVGNDIGFRLGDGHLVMIEDVVDDLNVCALRSASIDVEQGYSLVG
ncbi:MAG: hypothetical protein AAF264_00895 [Pseudomonadota bacterium]